MVGWVWVFVVWLTVLQCYTETTKFLARATKSLRASVHGGALCQGSCQHNKKGLISEKPHVMLVRMKLGMSDRLALQSTQFQLSLSMKKKKIRDEVSAIMKVFGDFGHNCSSHL